MKKSGNGLAFRKIKNDSCNHDYQEVLAERHFKAGYIVQTKRIGMVGCPEVVMKVAITPEGYYIGNPKDAYYLVVKRGIVPTLRTPKSSVCSIGFCPKEKKWYGWSHRAIAGFGVGSKVKKGDCTAEYLKVGFRAKTFADARKMAEAFAESVS